MVLDLLLVRCDVDGPKTFAQNCGRFSVMPVDFPFYLVEVVVNSCCKIRLLERVCSDAMDGRWYERCFELFVACCTIGVDFLHDNLMGGINFKEIEYRGLLK